MALLSILASLRNDIYCLKVLCVSPVISGSVINSSYHSLNFLDIGLRLASFIGTAILSFGDNLTKTICSEPISVSLASRMYCSISFLENPPNLRVSARGFSALTDLLQALLIAFCISAGLSYDDKFTFLAIPLESIMGIISSINAIRISDSSMYFIVANLFVILFPSTFIILWPAPFWTWRESWVAIPWLLIEFIIPGAYCSNSSHLVLASAGENLSLR